MENFKKLSREEMKNVSGGVGGCGSCATSGGCSNATIGSVPCPNADPDGSSVCQTCVCKGVTYYPCAVF